MPTPEATKINDHELELHSTDTDNFPYIKMRGLLGWISGAWAKITGRTVGSSNAIDVAIVDGAGAHVTTFGGGTQYTEGDTDATITGTAVMWEDAANTLVAASAAKPLPVTASIDTTGLATTTTDTNTGTIAGDTTSIDGKIPALGQALAAASVPVVLPAAQITTLTPPAAITGFATSAKQDTIIGHVDGIETLLGTIDADTGTIAAKDFATQTTLAALNAKLVTGTDIGDVTINNSTGASAVNIQDGGNTITVDGTVAVTNAGITTIAGAVAGTEMQVDVLTMPTTTVQATNLDIRDLTATDVVTAEIKPLASCGSGVTTVTTAGTQVALGSSTAIDSVTIKALSTNTGLIYVGTSTVSSADGFQLSAGDSVSLDVDNLTDVYVDSAVNGEGVSYIYVT